MDNRQCGYRFNFNRSKSLGAFVCSVPRNAIYICFYFSYKEPILSNIQNDFLSFPRHLVFSIWRSHMLLGSPICRIPSRTKISSFSLLLFWYMFRIYHIIMHPKCLLFLCFLFISFNHSNIVIIIASKRIHIAWFFFTSLFSLSLIFYKKRRKKICMNIYCATCNHCVLTLSELLGIAWASFILFFGSNNEILISLSVLYEILSKGDFIDWIRLFFSFPHLLCPPLSLVRLHQLSLWKQRNERLLNHLYTR